MDGVACKDIYKFDTSKLKSCCLRAFPCSLPFTYVCVCVCVCVWRAVLSLFLPFF